MTSFIGRFTKKRENSITKPADLMSRNKADLINSGGTGAIAYVEGKTTVKAVYRSAS